MNRNSIRIDASHLKVLLSQNLLVSVKGISQGIPLFSLPWALPPENVFSSSSLPHLRHMCSVFYFIGGLAISFPFGYTWGVGVRSAFLHFDLRVAGLPPLLNVACPKTVAHILSYTVGPLAFFFILGNGSFVQTITGATTSVTFLLLLVNSCIASKHFLQL